MLPRDPILKYERRRQQAERKETWRRDRRDRRRAKEWCGMPSPGALAYVPARQVEGQSWRAGRIVRNGR